MADLHQLPIGQGTLSLFTNEQGGIIDDTIIMQQQDSLYVVTNAACADKDLAHIRKHLAEYQKKGFDVDFDIIQDHSLIALQGPKAAEVLEGLVGKSLGDFSFMHGRQMDIAGVPCHVARSGYTGEDGFEASPCAGRCIRNSFLNSFRFLPTKSIHSQKNYWLILMWNSPAWVLVIPFDSKPVFVFMVMIWMRRRHRSKPV